MNKKDTTTAIMAANGTSGDTALYNKLMTNKLAVLTMMLEEATAGTDTNTGSKIAEAYRAKYREQAALSEHKAKTATGRSSLNNGDPLALALEALLPAEVCAVCDAVQEVPTGETAGRYTHLNEGMRRMNAGNRIRAAIKRDNNEHTIEAVLLIVAGVRAERPEEAVAA